jgi:hypothetical protein
MAKISKKPVETSASKKLTLEEIKQRLVNLKTTHDISEIVIKEFKKYAKDRELIEYDIETIALKMHENNHGYSLQFCKKNYLYNPFKKEYEEIHRDQNIMLFTSIDAIVGKDYILKNERNKIILCVSIQKGDTRGGRIVVKNTSTDGYEKRKRLLNPSATEKLPSIIKNVVSEKIIINTPITGLNNTDAL